MVTNNIAHQEITTESRYFGLSIMCSGKNPCYVEILNKTYRELTLITARYSRVVVVRLDFKLSDYGRASKVDISRFRKSFIRKLERKYECKVAYQWIREFGKSNEINPVHWHWWVAVKASDENRPNIQTARIHSTAFQSWLKHTGDKNSKVNKAGFFFLDRNDFSPKGRNLHQRIIANGPSENEIDVFIYRKGIASRANKDVVVGGVIDECFYTLSYMAKVYTKTRTEKTKSKPIFGNSNINTKHQSSAREKKIESNLSEIREWLKLPLEPRKLNYVTKVRTKKEKKDDESPALVKLI